ncbi:MAG TPA: 3-deoxy-7-phosphoheptulonate synthase [Candidatus Obscuribacter sp.]|nr:3-deoxy-7-phosphoheptulonate synthase [Candidatus Obscuribacter sp.]HMW90081.1 3-deoxy-7-phosphoheptulonate synthase [Candidatus Obscuribacter sp.]HND08163.1 3-deoxy-7-phosphoheptulonate synthase [Candidatus Obscuribacter sp.]HNG20017.1 3-deoxy-7-phosphoheptulonate synthase [Candidatus Obscuribacter sp.]HNG76279.1 3-deoxy-7-phosphoheptulonate synthase [Candidatus Obscuribacter sp.]
MILSFRKSASRECVETAVRRLAENGLNCQIVAGADNLVIVVTSPCEAMPGHFFSHLEGVEKVVKLTARSPLAAESGCSVVKIGSAGSGRIALGEGKEPVVIAGPCSVESREQIIATAGAVKTAGAQALRGGAFKPRTNPYDFQGLGLDGLKFMAEAGQASGMPVVSEVMDVRDIEAAEPYLDVFQVGARNMYNYDLLKELGRQTKPVLLKRGLSATIDELLQAAEYILVSGNLQVILCERGIRTYETRVRNTLDLSAVVILKSLTALPVLVDPSHATGKRAYVRALSRAAIACGADGLIVEAHLEPERSISDAAQAIDPATLKEIVEDAALLSDVLGKRDRQQSLPDLKMPVS